MPHSDVQVKDDQHIFMLYRNLYIKNISKIITSSQMMSMGMHSGVLVIDTHASEQSKLEDNQTEYDKAIPRYQNKKQNCHNY